MKNYQKVLLGLIILSVICFIAGYIIWHPVKVGLCPTPKNWQDIACEDKFPIEDWGKSLYAIPLFTLPIFLVLFFLSENFYLAWRRFALIYGIIGIFLISITPVSCGNIVCIFQKMWVLLYVGSLFIILSLLIIIYQAIKLFRKKTLEKQVKKI